MFAKSTLLLALLALLALSAQLAVATPPACLLAAVNTEPDPANRTTICGADAFKVESQIQSLCGNSSDAAMSAFTSVCSAAGKTLPTSGSSSASASGTGSSSASSATSQKSTTATTTGVPLNPASGGKATTSSSPTTSTGSASHANLGSFAAAVVAAAGLVMGL